MSAPGPQQRNVRGSSNPTLSFLCRASPGPCWEDKPPFVTFLFWMRLGRRLWGDGCLPQGSESWMSWEDLDVLFASDLSFWNLESVCKYINFLAFLIFNF